MPLVDVTDLLVDPDIAGQAFEVIRRQETVNNFGESTVVVTRAPAFGSIQPGGSQELQREDAFDVQVDTIKICTTFRLRGVTRGPSGRRFKPDIIVYGGSYYELISPNDWTAFGAGFIEAEATSIRYVEDAPNAVAPWRARLNFSNTQNSILAYPAGGIGC